MEDGRRRRALAGAILSGAALLFVCFLIFFLSSQDAEVSGNASGFFSKFVFRLIYGDAPGLTEEEAEALLGKVDSVVRVTAHFAEYALLGAEASLFALNISILSGGRLSLLPVAVAAAACILFAFSDEIHQIFVPGRAFEISDILTDSAGIITGCLPVYFLRRRLI